MKQKILILSLLFRLCCSEELEFLLGKDQKYAVLFSSDNNVKETLIKLIEEEKEDIKAAIYFLTDLQIAKALINAHKRGIKVTIITDKSNIKDSKYSKIFKLHQEGIPIYIYGEDKQESLKDGIMHHKFAVFKKNFKDLAITWTGSFNWTHSAQAKNKENVIIICSSWVARAFSENFKQLIYQCKKLSHTKNENQHILSA